MEKINGYMTPFLAAKLFFETVAPGQVVLPEAPYIRRSVGHEASHSGKHLHSHEETSTEPIASAIAGELVIGRELRLYTNAPPKDLDTPPKGGLLAICTGHKTSQGGGLWVEGTAIASGRATFYRVCEILGEPFYQGKIGPNEDLWFENDVVVTDGVVIIHLQ